MNYIKSQSDKKKLHKMCRDLDTKSTHMLPLATFLTQLSKIGVVLDDKDWEYFQDKFLLKNGKVTYQEAIADLCGLAEEQEATKNSPPDFQIPLTLEDASKDSVDQSI